MFNYEFLALKKDSLVDLLSQSDLVVSSENDIWNALSNLNENDPRNRGKFMFELLQKVLYSDKF